MQTTYATETLSEVSLYGDKDTFFEDAAKAAKEECPNDPRGQANFLVGYYAAKLKALGFGPSRSSNAS